MRLFVLLLLPLLALTAFARGQGAPSSDPFADPTPWPPQEVQVVPPPMLLNVAPVNTPERLRSLLATARAEQLRAFVTGATPAQLASLMAAATPADLLRTFTALAGRPEALTALLRAADPRALGNVVTALATRAERLAVDPAAGVDLDLLAAISEFGSLDPRYREVGNYSYYGRQLYGVRSRIAAEGMTPELKAEIIALYRQATEALRAFQAAEAAGQKP